MLKYKLKLKDVKLEDFRVYLFSLFKGILPKKKIKNIDDLKSFIQKKSAWVSQVTLYGYLKTRMGLKYVTMFDDEVSLGMDTLKKVYTQLISALNDVRVQKSTNSTLSALWGGKS